MATDSRYLVTSPLQEVFRDKTSGAPLRNGVVYFWKDDDRTVEKPVYKQTGSPGDGYDYAELPNPLTLSSIGTFQDPNTNDDIKVYFKPYVSDDSNEIELYYVEVYSEGGKVSGVLQFTRQGWPPDLAAEQTTAQDLTNYVPNGQFLVHTDIPAVDAYVEGEIRDPSTIIAQGGWTFDRPIGTTAKDIVTFIPIEATDNPTGNPRFAVNVNCETPNAGDTVKDLRLKFDDVNKFASQTDIYTYAFSAQNNNTGSITAQLILIKDYGTGGSSSDSIPLSTITIPEAYTTISTSFSFGTNESESITDDSYLQLAIRFPTASGFDVQLTDFILTPGSVTVTDFPPTTDADFKRDSIFGGVDLPEADGSNLYLVPRLTKYGMTWDTSEIGDVVMETQTSVYVDSLHPTTNRMLADGAQYETTHYSPLGIPYSRLQTKYWIESIQTPRYGTGADYFTGIFSGSGNELRVTNNTDGAVTNAADVDTGFTIATIHTGGNYYTKAYLVSSNTFYLQNLQNGGVATASAGTSGFTVTTIHNAGFLNSLMPLLTSITTVAAAALAGTYFLFNSFNAGLLSYYVWYKVDGVGADPAPGGTGIEIDLVSTDTDAIVAQKTREALNGWQETTVLTTAASAITTGSYFTINSTSTAYYIWYKKDGAGTDPAPASKTGIQVDIVTDDTNTQVASKTQRAINQLYFAAPDFRGQFLRGWDDGAGVDPNAATRYSLVPGVIGDILGTFELCEVQAHYHTYSDAVGAAPVYAAGGNYTNIDEITGVTGGNETRPINANVNFAIKY